MNNSAAMQAAGITAMQIRKLHALISRLNIPDDEYRRLLGDYRVETSKDLTEDEAQELIQRLEEEAVSKGAWVKGQAGKKYEELGRRKGMASPKQLRMIEAMWKDVSRARSQEARGKALRHFLKRIAGVEEMRFLESRQAHNVIEALKQMRRTA